jgi:zinc protease
VRARPVAASLLLGIGFAAALGSGCAFFARPAWEQEPPPVRTGPVVDASRLRRAELANGLELIVFEDARLPHLGLGVAVRRGAALETNGEAGLATFTAELMSRGAGSRRALELAQVVDDLGASLDTSAGWDSMGVSVSGLSRDADTLFAVLADVVLRPRFDADEGAKVRREILAGLEGQKDNPTTLGRIAFGRALYDGHRFGLPAEGAPEAVKRLRAESAREFHGRVFSAGNAILFATGDVKFEDVRARAEAAFGAWPRGVVPEPPPPPPSPAPAARQVIVVDRPDLAQAQILIGHDGMARTDPGRMPAILMNEMLGGGGFTTRLMARVRSDAGLAYGAYSAFAMRRAPGPFLASTSTRVPEARRTIDLVLGELERARTSGFGAEELAAVQRLAAGSFVLGLETSGDVTQALVDLDVQALPPDSLDTYRERVMAVSLEDVQRAARERLHPDRAAIVVVGPAAVLAPTLEGLGPLRVEQP